MRRDKNKKGKFFHSLSPDRRYKVTGRTLAIWFLRKQLFSKSFLTAAMRRQ